MKTGEFWGSVLGKVLGKISEGVNKTGAIMLPFSYNPKSGLHVRDDRVTKL